MKSALALALVLGTVSLQATERLMLKWSELDAVIVGKKITTVLPDGRKVEGGVVAVKPDSLVLRNVEIPRGSVSTLKFSKRGWKWRVIGAVGGFIVGGLGGAAIGDKINRCGSLSLTDWCEFDGIVYGGMIGLGAGSVGGYLVGRRADRRTTLVEIMRQ
jgi:hypothetical protein